MILQATCQGCDQPLELEEAYAVHDGPAEAELQRWHCGGCGAITEDVLPLDGSVTRVA